MASPPTSTLNPAEDEERERSGGTVIWLFVVLVLLPFGLFFLAFAVTRRADPETFLAGQEKLHPLMGAINTGVLLTGGWLAARGVLANRMGAGAREL